jgi:nitrile hydratase beta subunit
VKGSRDVPFSTAPMDGIHDLGGMSGFGAVNVERGEPVFHETWEARVFGLGALSVAVLTAYNVDEYRHSVERMDPVHYLAASYYERMLTGIATLLIEKGVVTHEELETRAGGRFPISRPVAPLRPIDVSARESARFAVGDTVVVRDIHPPGHTRDPRYVRGKRGVVVHVAPRFSFPDAAAHGSPLRLEHTYHVQFQAAELWAEAAGSNEAVIVDLWDSYLEVVS